MNPVVLLWVSTLAGAALFFAAGALAVRRRALAGAGAAAGAQLGPTQSAMALATPNPAASSAAPELATLRGESTMLRQQTTALQRESERLRASLAATEEQLKLRDAEATRFRRALEEVQGQASQDATGWQKQRADLEERVAKLPRLEAELEQRRVEIARWRQEIKEVESQLARAPAPQTEQTLRQDLAVKSQLLAAAERRLVDLEIDNARLRQEVGSATSLREERDRLRSENAQLRAKAFAAGGAPIATLPVRHPTPVAGTRRGDLFQAFVNQVSKLGDVRCAVVADELGLVVASHGDLSDEVAAVGALFARAGGKAIEVLPLRNVHHVTIEDDQRVALTLHPLPTKDGKESDLALITLGVGAALDAHTLTRLINEGPRKILSS